MMSSSSSPKCAEVEPKTRRQAAPSSPSPRAVSSIERTITPALPSSSGCARSISGHSHSSPCRSRSSERRKGEPTAIGWVAEQSSWSNPGTVSSLDRAPAADPVLGLEHRHLDAIACQLHRGGEPIRPRADDDRLAQGLGEYPGDFVPPTGRDSSRATAPPSTTTGKSKDSSSHGWLVTMSFTAIVPSSSRPSTASQIS